MSKVVKAGSVSSAKTAQLSYPVMAISSGTLRPEAIIVSTTAAAIWSEPRPDNGSQLMSTWAYQLAFTDFEFGQGAAVGNMLLIFCLIVAFFYIRETRREAVIT